MEGFFINKNESFLSQFNHPASVTRLLASGDDVDIMIFEAIPGRPCSITPGESPELLEYFYVLEGSAVIKLDDGDISVEKGDNFYAYHLKGSVYMESESGVKLLYVSSKPIFKFLYSFQEDLEKLIKESESKDVYTHNHAYRVQMYSIKICEKLKMSKDIIYTLAVSSLFHDIGKCIIPDEVLKKPGKLSADEYELIKSHSGESGKLLRNKFEDIIYRIVEQHHERMDGSGYPKGLKGDEILLEARIIAVADSYDAMTSDRAYRKAMSPMEAFKEIKYLTPKYYDERVVQAFEEILREEGVI